MTATGDARAAAAVSDGAGTSHIELRASVPDGVLAAGLEPVRLSWRLLADDPATAQEAYEVEAAADDAFSRIVGSTGVVEGDRQLAVDSPGPPLRSREVRFLRARVRTSGHWSPWSNPVRIEAGLLRAEDWIWRARSPCPVTPAPTVRHPPPSSGGWSPSTGRRRPPGST